MGNQMGNLEIAIEGISQDKLEDFLDFVAYSAELMGFQMVGRAYMSSEEETEDIQGNTHAKKVGPTQKREGIRRLRRETRGNSQARQGKS